MVGRRLAVLSLCWAAASAAWCAPPARYAFGEVVDVDIPSDAYWTSPLEDKPYFDCRRFRVRPVDVRFALRHAHQVSESYWMNDMNIVSIGCHASVVVRFKNGDTVDVMLEPTGRIFARPANGRSADQPYFYVCRRCEETFWWDDPERTPPAPRSGAAPGASSPNGRR